MPEASVHQNNRTVLWQNDIRRTWQIPAMHSESKPARMQLLSYERFRASILSSDAGHHSGPSLPVDNINHTRNQAWKKGLYLVS